MAVNTVGTGGASTLTANAPQPLGTRDKQVSASLRLAQGNRELARFGAALSKLRSSLERLENLPVAYSRRVEDEPVTVRSRELGLSYDPAPGDLAKSLGDIPALAGINAGTFTINGVTLSVDPAADTLSAVLARINASGAGVTASLDTEADRLELTSDASRRPVALGDGTSGLFSALKTAPRQYVPSATRTPSLGEPRVLRGLLRDAADALEELFGGGYSALDADLLGKTRASLRAAIGEATRHVAGSDGDVLRTGLGMEFDFRASGRPPGRALLNIDARELSRALEGDFEGVRSFLMGREGEVAAKGLAPTLRAAVEAALGSAVGDLGVKLAEGVMLDMKA